MMFQLIAKAVLLAVPMVSLSAGQVLVDEPFGGTALDSAWTKATSLATATVSDGSLYLETANTSSGQRALVARNTDSQANTNFNDAALFNFYDHDLIISLDLNNVGGAITGASRISYFMGIASASSAGNLSPYDAEDSIHIALDLNSTGYRIITYEEVGGGGTAVTHIGYLSGVPTNLTVTLDRNNWLLEMAGATFTQGAFTGTSTASGFFSTIQESDFSDFYFCAGVRQVGAAVTAGSMTLDHVEISTFVADTSELRCKLRSDIIMSSSVLTDWDKRYAMMTNIVALDYVDGFHVQLYWDDFEPTNGVYDHSVISNALAAAEAAGKTCSLALVACYFTPEWMKSMLDDSNRISLIYPGIGLITTPIPWRAQYKYYLNRAIAELADKYDGRLDYISVTGPATYFGIEAEFTVDSYQPTNEVDKLGGYTRQNYEDEWKDCIDYFYDCFPNTTLGLTMHTHVDLPSVQEEQDLQTSPDLREYLLDKVNGDRVVFKLAGLNKDSDVSGIMWPGSYQGEGNNSNYQELIVPVRDVENVQIALESGPIMLLRDGGYTAAEAKEELVSALSFDADSIEMFRMDIWDIYSNPQRPVTNYAAQMAWCGNYGVNQFNATHEQGGLWDDVVCSSETDLYIAACGLAGTDRGLAVNAASVSYVSKDLEFDVFSEKVLCFRFYIDPNSIDMAQNDGFRVVRVMNSSGIDACQLALQKKLDGYHLTSRVYSDNGSSLEVNNSTITDAEHYVEVLVTRSDTASSSNGTFQVFIDDEEEGTATGIDNFDRFDEAASVEFGTCYVISAQDTEGFYILDEIRVQGHGEYIGPRI